MPPAFDEVTLAPAPFVPPSILAGLIYPPGVPDGVGVSFRASGREVNQMGRNIWRGAVLAASISGVVGCATTPDARYVYQDGEYGVIGIPRNTSLGKKDFREQAHHLMTEHFPEGYEIVRAEEVVEGERTLDTARKVELDSEPGFAALNQALKIGKFAKSTSSDQKDSLKITESRILYRRKPQGTSTGHDGFAAQTNLAPELYLDPNQEMRKALKEGSLLAKKDVKPDDKDKDKKVAEAKPGGEKSDSDVQKANIPASK